MKTTTHILRRGNRSTRPPSKIETVTDGDIGDGGLALLNKDGEIVQVASRAVTSSLRSMVTRTRLTDGGGFPDLLGLTSALSGEGVTFLCRSLAVVLANDAGRRVCIVDLNWAHPSDMGDGAVPIGIADVIRGTVPLEAAVTPTGNPGVSMLPAGLTTVSERPVLAGSAGLTSVFSLLSASYDHVLLDLPAVRASSEALALAEQAGVLALVVRQGVTPEGVVKSTLEELSGIPVLGVILNRASSKVPSLLLRRIPEA
jgi:Mrp family chromosome partitioning ATPase